MLEVRPTTRPSLRTLAAVTVLAALTAITPLQAAPAGAAPAQFVPKAQNLLNVPKAAGGTEGQQYAVSRFVRFTLGAMPRGSVARIATYDLNQPEVVDALLAAHRRGVTVKVIVDGEVIGADEQRLMRVLGGNVKANKSYAIACKDSCNSPKVETIMHAKIFTFSSTGRTGKLATARKISVLGSANLTTTNQYLNWNQSQVLTDPDIYNGLIKYFDQMRLDSNKNAYSSFGSKDGRYRVSLWPSGSTSTDIYLKALRSITSAQCRKNTAKGYGNAKRRTSVRVNIFHWTAGRKAIAAELVRLRKAGCDVAVAYTNSPAQVTMAQSVADLLYDGKVPLYNTRWKDADRDGRFDLYTHGKSLLVSGWLYGKNNKVVYNGSHNFTRNALTDGNESALRTDDNATYDAFKANFDRIQREAKLETKRPVTTQPAPKPGTQRQLNVPAAEEESELEELDGQ